MYANFGVDACLFFRVHPPPAFGSSSNLEALALEANESDACSTNINDDNSVHLVVRYIASLSVHAHLGFGF
jgi:hypothetical protein